MRRAIARLQTWWLRLFVLTILVGLLVPGLFPYDLILIAVLFGLFLVRPPASEHGPVDVSPPVRGRWAVLNSPGSSVPSHGVKAYGQAYAVDLLHPSADAPTSLGWSVRGRPPDSYTCFGEPVFAMAPGTVRRVLDSRRDHRARSSWPLVTWMLTVEGLARELGGPSGLLGNHVVVEHEDGTFAAYAHLRRGSVTVRPDDRVETGQQLAEVGNTGNTSEPHLHVQLMDRAQPTAAAGIPMHWPGLAVDPAQEDPRWSSGEPKPTALPGFPRNGQIFEVR